MGPDRISQPKSLSTDYTVGRQDVGSTSGPGKLGDHTVEQQQDGVARARRTQGSFVRFQGRLKASLQSFREIFTPANSVANQRATRFNARHEKFSESVQSLTTELKDGDASSIESADAMAAMRHEVKLLHQDARWASREQLFATRLDIEFSKLSDGELAT